MASRRARVVVAACLGASLLVLALLSLPVRTGSGSSATDDSAPSSEVPAASGDGSSGELSGRSGTSAEASGEEEGTGMRSYDSELDLADEATRLLEEYREKGSCLLMEAGYLDLLGNVWTCTVQGAGWVDVCVVSEAEGTGSTVRVIRMDVDEWRESYASNGGA